MIISALWFVFGAWNVQQLAQLPSFTWLLCAYALLMLLFVLLYQPRLVAFFNHANMVAMVFSEHGGFFIWSLLGQ